MASSSNPPPEQRAAELVNKLPSSPNLITKTGTAVLGTGLIATAISQELYVVNEESIILIASIIFFTYLGKVCTIAMDTSGADGLNGWCHADHPGALP